MRFLFRSFNLRLPGLLLALSLAATAAACSDGGEEGEGGETTSGTPPSGELAPPIAASTLREKLAAVGVDPDNPPPWDTVAEMWESKEDQGHEAVYAAAKPLMELFEESLGVDCYTACHMNADYSVPEERKRLIVGMWDEWVSGFRFQKEGDLLFCDSCHQGKADFLRRDEHITAWMQENFVAQLRQADGADVSCATCHGQPHVNEFLESWPPSE